MTAKKNFLILMLISGATLIGQAHARGGQDPFAEMDEGSAQIKKVCGDIGGQINERGVVSCTVPGQPGSPKVVNAPKKNSEERSSALKCLIVDKYLYCNDEEFYERVSPVIKVQLKQIEQGVMDSNREGVKPVQHTNGNTQTTSTGIAK